LLLIPARKFSEHEYSYPGRSRLTSIYQIFQNSQNK
jgi:hypothetical protein